MSIGRGLLRFVVGGSPNPHSCQKLSARFGAERLEATASAFAAARLGPGRGNTIAAGAAATVGDGGGR
jgi:hypothetical protein